MGMLVFSRSAFWALFFYIALTLSPALAEQFLKGPAVIQTPTGQQIRLKMEYAISVAQREQGLMGRTKLGPNDGMVFDFGDSRNVVMWMKNTPLPLDMLFIDEKGAVTGIAARTKPYSEDLIPSPGPVRYVIELNGGRAQALGIGPGSMVIQGIAPPP
ncbi:DUF192 domain-containing protein [Agrobacterium vitis]|nr:DUF192 domain-containing protein [Agrobacterium vitis]MCE6073437.1 DUF192 domain-containing protein [Agrobacterium vitis]MCF1453451.1 DUF192 domain-containing protein [Agrobacterium vitis]MCM2452442.1 DUF192 domain-containing protein [Agrobacterium vitis]MCM2469368.1 DUF192 domain-containing protein [Agrobacterium vitis]MUO69158.1 DUF192 domain-containing protein [Agrobacterium vitis]